jgi:hypothetical protein
MRFVCLFAAAVLTAPATARAQDMPGMDMSGHEHSPSPPASAPVDPPSPSHDHEAMMKAMGHAAMPGMGMTDTTTDMHGMVGALGHYGMMRDASGTAWQPDSAPMNAVMGHVGGWSTMVHGYATLVYDRQGGPRGDTETFSASMLMGMGQHPLGDGTLTLRAMISLDPLMGKSGYPLLLATGETADGQHELVDRQHPHDAVMELAAVYSRPLGDAVSGFLYLGLPGEPALGPAAYMHRFSGTANPEAPIDHHWLDSTHVTFGVATAGVVRGNVKLEASLFTGREPDQHRWNIERPRFDSWSIRASWNPTANLSMQTSHGLVRSPERLHPEEDVHRTTTSITYNLPLGPNRIWQSTAAWGRNDPSGGDRRRATDAFLFDSAVQIGRNTVFARIETVKKDELFGDGHDGNPLASRAFGVTKLSLGGYHAIPIGRLAFDLGGLASRYGLPRAIRPSYGSNPTSLMLFARIRITG